MSAATNNRKRAIRSPLVPKPKFGNAHVRETEVSRRAERAG